MARAALVVALCVISAGIGYLLHAPRSTADSDASPEPATVTTLAKTTRWGRVQQGPQLAVRIADARTVGAETKAESIADMRVDVAAWFSDGAMACPRRTRRRRPRTAPVDLHNLETANLEITGALAGADFGFALYDCYEDEVAAKRTNVTMELRLTADPDLGTMIDVGRVVDESGKPLPPKFEDCVRTYMPLLHLPPLAEGDHVDVAYEFMFTKEEEED